MGYTGNEGTLDTDYLTSIDNRMVTNGTGALRLTLLASRITRAAS